MEKLRQFRRVILAVLSAMAFMLAATGVVAVHAAEGDEPPGPDRYEAVIVEVVVHEWWLIAWHDYEVNCSFRIDHEGMPTADDVYNACGEDLYDDWINTMGCPEAVSGGDTSTCQGYYLYEHITTTVEEKIGQPLPAAQVWVTLDNCIYSGLTNRCEADPVLVLTGEEPLPGESITAIHVILDGTEYSCGPTCSIQLGLTDPAGIKMFFWADSSYGDTSEMFELRLRVSHLGYSDSSVPLQYVDVISTQWRGGAAAGCSQVWDLFPPVGGPPQWLSTPDDPSQLASDVPLDYLAGHLISSGVVDASSCADGGLLLSGAASECGIDIARAEVYDWQNRFDLLIYDAASHTGVPAQLLKNLFSRESQFWPGNIQTKTDIGLGQLTENGADTAFLWNIPFFEQFCPFVLDGETCAKGYPFIDAEDQELLRGALVDSVDAVCPDCPLGVDIGRAELSVAIFAETLLANCGQAAYVVRQVSGVPTSDASTYEDMWRFTLVNYNAGPGCLTLALEETLDSGEPLQWGYVKTHLTPVCAGAGPYVDEISR